MWWAAHTDTIDERYKSMKRDGAVDIAIYRVDKDGWGTPVEER